MLLDDLYHSCEAVSFDSVNFLYISFSFDFMCFDHIFRGFASTLEGFSSLFELIGVVVGICLPS